MMVDTTPAVTDATIPDAETLAPAAEALTPAEIPDEGFAALGLIPALLATLASLGTRSRPRSSARHPAPPPGP